MCKDLATWTLSFCNIRQAHIEDNLLFRQIYSILKWGVFENSYCLEDYRVAHQIPPSARLFLPLRKRLYGVLFKVSPMKSNTIVKEWIMSGPESLDEAEEVVPTKIPGTKRQDISRL